MSWKSESRLADLAADSRFELTCRRCGLTRYARQEELMRRPAFRFASLEQVERGLACADRFCGGRIRLALVHDGLQEPFVGGLA